MKSLARPTANARLNKRREPSCFDKYLLDLDEKSVLRNDIQEQVVAENNTDDWFT